LAIHPQPRLRPKAPRPPSLAQVHNVATQRLSRSLSTGNRSGEEKLPAPIHGTHRLTRNQPLKRIFSITTHPLHAKPKRKSLRCRAATTRLPPHDPAFSVPDAWLLKFIYSGPSLQTCTFTTIVDRRGPGDSDQNSLPNISSVNTSFFPSNVARKLPNPPFCPSLRDSKPSKIASCCKR
jgi:hypothetical protein